MGIQTPFTTRQRGSGKGNAADPAERYGKGACSDFMSDAPDLDIAKLWSAKDLAHILLPSIIPTVTALKEVDTTTILARPAAYLAATREYVIYDRNATAGDYRPFKGPGFWLTVRSPLSEVDTRAIADLNKRLDDLWLTYATQAWVNSQLDDINGLINRIPEQLAAMADRLTALENKLQTTVNFNGLHRAMVSTTELALSASLQTYTLPASLQEGDLLEVQHQYNNSAAERQSVWVRVQAGSTQRNFPWADATNNAHYWVFPATLGSTFQVKQSGAGSAPRILSIKVWRDAASGVAVISPTTTDVSDFTDAGGATVYYAPLLPNRRGAQLSEVLFVVKDRRAGNAARRFQCSLPADALSPWGGNGWTYWRDGNSDVLYRDCTMPDATVYRIHVYWRMTPKGIKLAFTDSHSGTTNTYGAVDSLVAKYQAL